MNKDIIDNFNVYFDKTKRKFIQIRGTLEKGFIVGGYTDYFNDAKTTISENSLSEEYVLKNFVKVDFVDKFADFDGIGWKVKINKGDKK